MSVYQQVRLYGEIAGFFKGIIVAGLTGGFLAGLSFYSPSSIPQIDLGHVAPADYTVQIAHQLWHPNISLPRFVGQTIKKAEEVCGPDTGGFCTGAVAVLYDIADVLSAIDIQFTDTNRELETHIFAPVNDLYVGLSVKHGYDHGKLDDAAHHAKKTIAQLGCSNLDTPAARGGAETNTSGRCHLARTTLNASRAAEDTMFASFLIADIVPVLRSLQAPIFKPAETTHTLLPKLYNRLATIIDTLLIAHEAAGKELQPSAACRAMRLVLPLRPRACNKDAEIRAHNSLTPRLRLALNVQGRSILRRAESFVTAVGRWEDAMRAVWDELEAWASSGQATPSTLEMKYDRSMRTEVIQDHMRCYEQWRTVVERLATSRLAPLKELIVAAKL